MSVLFKAYAYITCGDHLLVFDHPHFPEAGTQVPGGSIEENESPRQAALREAMEETGLTSLQVVNFLGDTLFTHVTQDNQTVLHHRYFYHLLYSGDISAPWLAGELTPSDGTAPKVFLCYWAYLDAIPPLIAQMDRFLPQLKQSLAL